MVGVFALQSDLEKWLKRDWDAGQASKLRSMDRRHHRKVVQVQRADVSEWKTRSWTVRIGQGLDCEGWTGWVGNALRTEESQRTNERPGRLGTPRGKHVRSLNYER